MKRILTIAAVVLSVAIIIVLLIRNKKTLDSKNVVIDRSAVPVAVALYTAELLPVSGDLTFPATLSADEEASISAATSGRIASLAIELGSHVTKGQVIGRLDMKETEIKLQSTAVAIEKLRRDYERNKVLAAGNATNPNAVQDSKYELDTKVLEGEQLRKQIEDGTIVAPIGGIITEKKMIAGEYATTGSAIATVVDVSTLKAKVYVAENNVFSLKRAQEAVLTTEVYPGETFRGHITYISPKGDDNHNYLVELSIQNNKTAQLRAGVYATVKFTAEQTQHALQIPKIALVDGVKNPYIYVAMNDKVIERKLVLGREIGENIEVLQGLKKGEQVVTNGQINIVQGSTIKAINNQ